MKGKVLLMAGALLSLGTTIAGDGKDHDGSCPRYDRAAAAAHGTTKMHHHGLVTSSRADRDEMNRGETRRDRASKAAHSESGAGPAVQSGSHKSTTDQSPRGDRAAQQQEQQR